MQVAGARREPTSIPAEQVEALVLHPKTEPLRPGQGLCWFHG